jgi:PKD domain
VTAWRLACLTVAAICATASPAGASQGTGALFNGDHDATLTVGIANETDPASPMFHPSHESSSLRPFVYEAVPNSSPGSGLEHLCNAAEAPFDPTGSNIPWGWRYTVYRRDRATGQLIGEPELICVPLADPTSPNPPPPPALPQPPTLGEIWNAAALPAPEIGISPTVHGVTGLETWMWAANPRTVVSVSVTLDGFTVTGTARLAGYRFDFGDGAPVETTTGGSEQQPPARHTYETKGTYTIRVSSVWRGEFVMTGPGITTPLPVDLRTVQLTNTRGYEVVEVRSVLVG